MSLEDALDVPSEKTYTEDEVALLVQNAWREGFDAGMRGRGNLDSARAEMRGERSAVPFIAAATL